MMDRQTDRQTECLIVSMARRTAQEPVPRNPGSPASSGDRGLAPSDTSASPMSGDGGALLHPPPSPGRPSRHLWVGNVPFKPSRAAIEALFSKYGSLDGVRVFPGKTFAFVNYTVIAHAASAIEALDGAIVPSVSGALALPPARCCSCTA
jgi:RNA recognition motif. (a.k.a. RRM, RBD, or RNP domain)